MFVFPVMPFCHFLGFSLFFISCLNRKARHRKAWHTQIFRFLLSSPISLTELNTHIPHCSWNVLQMTFCTEEFIFVSSSYALVNGIVIQLISIVPNLRIFFNSCPCEPSLQPTNTHTHTQWVSKASSCTSLMFLQCIFYKHILMLCFHPDLTLNLCFFMSLWLCPCHSTYWKPL